MNVLVFGAGAIGGYLGGSLAMHGHRVVFLERAHNAPQLKNGFSLNLGEQIHKITNVEVLTSIEEGLKLSKFDITLFALKSYDTAAAMDAMRPHVAALPPFLCLQNGAENEAALAAVLGADKVIAGTVTTSVAKDQPGQIRLERLRGVGLAAGHSLSEAIATAFDQAGLNPELYASADSMKWSKLLTNLLCNASCAILDMSPSDVMADPELFGLEMMQLRESLAVMKAQKLQVVDLPKTPVRALAFAASRLPLAVARPLMGRSVGRGRGGKMPSLHIDLHSGKGRSEVDWLNGAVVRAGRQANVETPVNTLLVETLTELIRQRTPARLTKAELLRKLSY
ncbi:MAG: 2-dehydropantoate 2-reductase [Anaerolineales bacterium]